ncbi:MAG: hypothetical protein ACRDBQ_18400 [Shewanella sp.]
MSNFTYQDIRSWKQGWWDNARKYPERLKSQMHQSAMARIRSPKPKNAVCHKKL